MIKSIFDFRLFFIPAILLIMLQPAGDWVLPYFSGTLGDEEAEVTLALAITLTVMMLLYCLDGLVVVAFFRWRQGAFPDGAQLLHFALFYEICWLILKPYYTLLVSWWDGTLDVVIASVKQFTTASEVGFVSLMITFGFTTIMSMLVSVALTWLGLWLAGKVLGIFWKSETSALA